MMVTRDYPSLSVSRQRRLLELSRSTLYYRPAAHSAQTLAFYRKPRTTVANPGHRVYPYLLRGLTIERPNHAWCSDITYIPVRGGFLYLVVIMDWASRRVLAWRLSNTMDTKFCLEALTDALEHFGGAEIFNTDSENHISSRLLSDGLSRTRIEPVGR